VGSSSVSTSTVMDGTTTYNLWYPTTMTSGHAILTFGVGTGGVTSQYADTLSHLASWGFVVVAVVNGATGTGVEILAAANYMVTQHSLLGSTFYQKLDVLQIGVFGHSQGAGGTVKSVFLSGGSIIKSALTYAIPDPGWWGPPTTPVPTMSSWPTSIPLIHMRGANDIFIATEGQAKTAWYNPVSGPAAKATLKSPADHNTIQVTNNGLKGYIAAWFRYTLNNDTTAKGAFVAISGVANTPELPTNTRWQYQQLKNLV